MEMDLLKESGIAKNKEFNAALDSNPKIRPPPKLGYHLFPLPFSPPQVFSNPRRRQNASWGPPDPLIFLLEKILVE